MFIFSLLRIIVLLMLTLYVLRTCESRHQITGTSDRKTEDLFL